MPASVPESRRSTRTHQAGRGLRIASAAAVAASMPLVGIAVLPAAAMPAAVADPASSGQCLAVTSGEMSWGIKQSLRNYITGPIAGGHWDLDHVTYTGANNAEDGAFHFTADPARSAVQGDAADLPMPGTLKLTGHGGIINVTMTNFTLQIRGNKAQLLADGRYLAADAAALSSVAGGAPAFVQQPVATFTLDQTLTQAGAQNGSATLTGSSWINENLNKGMLGAYGEGKNDGDPVTVTLGTAPGGNCAVDADAVMATSPGQPDRNAPAPQGAASPAAPAAPAAPAPAPQATTDGQGGDAASCGTVNSASVGWGLKKSFRSYLTGPIAGGHWDLDGVGFAGSQGGDDGAFQFSADPSAVKVSGGDADIPLRGSVHLTGHLGALDITYTNMSVKVRGTTAQFIADYRSNTVSSFTAGASVTGAKTGAQVPIAQFTLDQPVSGGSVNLTGPGFITEDGNQSLGGQYGEGNNEADPINIALDTSGDCSGGGLEGLQSAGAASSGGAAASGDVSTGTPDLGLSRAPRVVGASPSTTTGAGAGSADTCDASDGDRKVVEDRMGWGIKESFRSYIRGSIAKGDWTPTGGAVYSEGNFVFSGSDGSVKVSDGSVTSGTLKFGGSVLFTGHEGVLRTTISDPEIRIDGGTGTLVANVQSNDTSGNPQDFGRIAVADLGIEGASVKDDIVDGSASASLSSDGATALAGFYEPGSALDPVSFRAALSSGCDSSSTASLGDKPEDESDKDKKDKDKKDQNRKDSGKVTVHDNADSGDKHDEDTGLVAFLKDPASVIPSAIALIAVIIAGIFGVQLRRSRTSGDGAGSDGSGDTGAGE
jgi:hypothetical protein